MRKARKQNSNKESNMKGESKRVWGLFEGEIEAAEYIDRSLRRYAATVRRNQGLIMAMRLTMG